MKQVEYWRWRYRDPQTGRVCRTMFQLTAEEAAKYPEAERIAGSMLVRDVEDSLFADTRPRVFRTAAPKVARVAGPGNPGQFPTRCRRRADPPVAKVATVADMHPPRDDRLISRSGPASVVHGSETGGGSFAG
jgi:hypothetical protein